MLGSIEWLANHLKLIQAEEPYYKTSQQYEYAAVVWSWDTGYERNKIGKVTKLSFKN